MKHFKYHCRSLITPLWLLFVATGITPQSQAAEQEIDYNLYGALYAWYGQLDLGTVPTSLATQEHELDFTQYPGGNPVAGSHHILNIAPQSSQDGLTQVEVTLEYQEFNPDNAEGQGHYLIQELSLIPGDWLISASKTVLDETDDFSSNYRPSSDTNLIRALIYRWTQVLDSPKQQSLTPFLAKEASFVSAERQIKTPEQYLNWLLQQDYLSSRRAIKNWAIKATDSPGEYSVVLEYQWTAVNRQGETELAQLEVKVLIQVKDGVASILDYREAYLPPVTDVGAEIRC